MLDFLKPMDQRDIDFLTFIEGDDENQITVITQMYADRGQPVGGSALGSTYHIVLFRDSTDNKNEYSDADSFEAILTDPLEYMSGLILNGFYGIIAKKTTTSNKVIAKVLDKVGQTV